MLMMVRLTDYRGVIGGLVLISRFLRAGISVRIGGDAGYQVERYSYMHGLYDGLLWVLLLPLPFRFIVFDLLHTRRVLAILRVSSIL
jgi:hypothetical protein